MAWVADFCQDKGVKFILGHALHEGHTRGKAKKDKIDSEKITRLLCSSMFPKAPVYPRELRGMRDLMRRRMRMARRRGEHMPPVQNPLTQYNHPTRVTDLRVVKNIGQEILNWPKRNKSSQGWQWQQAYYT